MCPLVLLSHAAGRRLGQGCQSRRSAQGLWGESLLQSLRPSCSPAPSLCWEPQLPPKNSSQGLVLFSCLLGIAITFVSASLWCVAAAEETGQAVGRMPCAQHPVLCLPWADTLSWLCRGTSLSHSLELHVHPCSVTHTTQDSCPWNCLIVFVTTVAKLRCYRALEALKVFCFLAYVCVCVCVCNICEDSRLSSDPAKVT